MIPIFQSSPTPQSRRARARLEDAFAMLLQNCSEGDFTRLYDAIEEIAFIDPSLYFSLRGHHLTSSIFNMVAGEDEYRRSRPMQERIQK